MSTQALEFKSMLDDALFAHGLRKMEAGAKKSGSVISSSFSKAGAAIGGALSFGALAAATKSLLNFSGETQDAAEKLNLSTTAMQGFNGAFAQSGATAEVVSKGFIKLNESIDAAREGSTDAKNRFEALGISMNEVRTHSPEKLLMMIAEAVKNSVDPVRTLASVMDLLGKSGSKMLPGLKEGAAGLQKLMDEVHKLTPADIKMYDAFGDAMTRLGVRSRVATGDAISGWIMFGRELGNVESGLRRITGASNFDMEAWKKKRSPKGGEAIPGFMQSETDLNEFSSTPKPSMEGARAVAQKRIRAQREENEKAEGEAFDAHMDLLKKEFESEQDKQQRIADLLNEAAAIRAATAQDAMSDEQRLISMERERLRIARALVTAKGEEAAQLRLYLAILEGKRAGINAPAGTGRPSTLPNEGFGIEANMANEAHRFRAINASASGSGGGWGALSSFGSFGGGAGGLTTGGLTTGGLTTGNLQGKAYGQTPMLSLRERRAAEDEAVARGEPRRGSTASASNAIRRGDRDRAKNAAKEEERKKFTVQGTNERLNVIIGLLGDNAGPVK